MAVVSCKAEVDLSYYVSELRQNVYVAEIDGLKVTVYPEKRETPYIADSYVGKLKNVIIVKIDSENVVIDDAKISLTYDKTTVNGNFIYSPISCKYTSQIEVENLPTSANIDATIICAEKEYKFSLLSVVNSKTITAKQALESVKKSDSGVVDKLFNVGKVEGEIHVRIMADGDRTYYYVGLISKDEIYAYLVDGKTGEVLAKKNNPKRT